VQPRTFFLQTIPPRAARSISLRRSWGDSEIQPSKLIQLHGVRRITPALQNSSISSLEYPRSQRILSVCWPSVGAANGSGPFDACTRAIRTWLEEMEYEVALRGAGAVPRLPASSTMVTAESPASLDGHIIVDRKQAGKPIAGNRHDGFEVAGAGTQLTVRLVRHSRRKRGATARPTLRSMAPVLDPTSVPAGA
jgi:hypothetical protein